MALVYCKSQQVAQALQIHFFHTQNKSKYSWISSTRGGSVTVYLNTFLLPMQTSWQRWTHTAPALGLNWVVSEHLVFAALLKICPDLLLFKTALVADTLTFAKSFSPEINGLGVSATHLYSVSGEIKVWVHTAQDITFPQPFSSAHEIFCLSHLAHTSSQVGRVQWVWCWSTLESLLAMWGCLLGSEGASCVTSACPPSQHMLT